MSPLGLQEENGAEQTNGLSRLMSPTAAAFIWILAAWRNGILQVSAVMCGRGQSSALLPLWGQEFGHGLLTAEMEGGLLSRAGVSLAAGWASMWKHLPSAPLGARAEGGSAWEEGAFGPSVALGSLEGMGKQREKQQMLCSMGRA